VTNPPWRQSPAGRGTPWRCSKEIPPNAIGEPVLPPTPLSPDFDPLVMSCDLTALSGFGGSLRPCCPKTAPGFALCSVRIVLRRSSLCTVPVELSEDGARFRALLRSDRLATFLPLHRSGRTARKHFSHPGSLHPSDPKVFGILHLLRSDRLATFFPRHRSGRTTRRHFVHRSLLHPAGPKAAPVSRRSTRFDPKTHLSFPGRSSGPGAIIRRVSATRPPAAYEDSLPKHPVLALSPRCPFHFPGCPVR